MNVFYRYRSRYMSRLYTHTYRCVCVCVYIYVYVYVCMCMCICLYMFTFFGLYICWVAVQELNFSYHNPEAILFTMCPYCGSLI